MACHHEGILSLWASACLEFIFRGPHKIGDLVFSVLCCNMCGSDGGGLF